MRLFSNLFKAAIALGMLVAVIGVGVVLYMSLSSVLGQAKDAVRSERTVVPAEGSVIFEIEPGQTVAEIIENLSAAGLIDNADLFRLRLKMSGQEASLKAGRFQLEPGMDWDTLIATLSTPPAEIGIRFTVIEGVRVEQIAETLSESGIVDKAAFLQLVTTPQGAATLQSEFVANSGKPAESGLEGYLFPDTYEIKQSEGDNSEAAARVMLKTMEEKVTPEIRQLLADKGKTVHQLLTVASIVQREGVVKEELPAIAAVFWNRVELGMSLGADPTTQYAVANETDWWPELNLDPNTVDHPYNTYNFPGLPPGPICNPGADAINATAYPDETDYLYFVAKNDGTGAHAFATTLEDHERNRVIYGNR